MSHFEKNFLLCHVLITYLTRPRRFYFYQRKECMPRPGAKRLRKRLTCDSLELLRRRPFERSKRKHSRLLQFEKVIKAVLLDKLRFKQL